MVDGTELTRRTGSGSSATPRPSRPRSTSRAVSWTCWPARGPRRGRPSDEVDHRRLAGRSDASSTLARPPTHRELRREALVIPEDLQYTQEHEWVRTEGDDRAGRRHRLRPGRARRHRLRHPARGRDPGAGRRDVRRGGVDQERLRHLRAGQRHRRGAQRGLDTAPELGQLRPVRRRLDARHPPRRGRRRRPATPSCWTRPPTSRAWAARRRLARNARESVDHVTRGT